MRAGRLRHRMTLQTKTYTADGKGGGSDTWTDSRDMWVSYEPLKGREYFDSQTVNVEITGRIISRYVSGVVPTMRWNWSAKSRTFEILHVINPDERNVELQMMVKEVVDN
jgi:SPP1 family predicted phage head-tail adaptor